MGLMIVKKGDKFKKFGKIFNCDVIYGSQVVCVFHDKFNISVSPPRSLSSLYPLRMF